ncbi:MAG: hypothetical protein ACLFUS_03175 [Candidatus Sumerlaeia bacterium]
MLEKADYLQISKRGLTCSGCGISLVETEKHPSVLVESDEEDMPEASTPTDAPEQTEQAEQAEQAPAQDKPRQSNKKDEDDDQGYRRLDYCADCWQKIKDQAYFSFWIGKRKQSDLPPKKLNRAERNMALVALFDSLNEHNGAESNYTPHLFFLAHLLMKYKIFKWKPNEDRKNTTDKVILFSRTDSEEEVRIPDIDMADELIVTIKGEIEEYLAKSTGQEVKL